MWVILNRKYSLNKLVYSYHFRQNACIVQYSIKKKQQHFFTLIKINTETRRAYYIRLDIYAFLTETIFLKTVDEESIRLWECSWWSFKKFELLQGGNIECWIKIQTSKSLNCWFYPVILSFFEAYLTGFL